MPKKGILHPPYGPKKNLKPLDYLFYPKNVAIIGASNEKDSVGRAIFENFFLGKKSRYCKRVFPVNPNHSKILGHKSFSKVQDIPVDLDLAVIVVPAKIVPIIFKGCIEKKIETVIIISAGFSEIGEQKLTQELQQMIDANPKTRVLGPNCVSGDTPLLIENDEKTHFCEIGQLVDTLLQENSEQVQNISGTCVLSSQHVKRKIKVASFDKNEIVYKPVNFFMKRPKCKSALKVFLEGGRTIVCSPDHPFFVKGKKGPIVKKAGELGVGDLVPHGKSFPLPQKNIVQINFFQNVSKISTRDIKKIQVEKAGKRVPIKKYLEGKNKNTNVFITTQKNQIKIPAKISITKELCEVIGYFISEGDFKKDCLRISYIKEKEVSKHLRKAINSIFSGHLDEKRTKEIKFGRKIGKILFQQVFGIRPYAKNKTAPDFIFSAELDKIIAFLSGLFTGDGGVHAYKNGQRATIYFHTISKKLAGQVLALLTMTGAGPFYVQEIKRKNTLVFGKRIDAQDIYAVRSDSKQAIATLYNQGFRFLSERKNKRLEQIIKKRRKFLSREDDLYHRKIKKIEKINGPIDLYDFEVDATHNFFAGQILTHNCFGIFVGDSGLNTTFSAQQKMLLPANGNVAFISQSGALGVNILDWAATQPFGISKFVSYGNAMDIDESDLLEYLRNDTKTKIITVYLEGVKHGHKFLEIAKKVSKKKPIIVLKGGVTQEAHQATISHTGSLAGNTEVYKAVFKQSGIIQAEDLMQLFNFAKILESEPLPKGNQVQIITNGGGYGIITADAIVKHGLKLANMSATNKNQLKKVFPSTVSINNPMDLVGDADAKRYKIAVTTALKDPDVNMVLVIILFNTPPIGEQVVRELAKIKKTAKKPLIVASTGSDFTQKMRAKLEKNNIPTFEYPELAASSLQALWKYSQVYQPNKNKD